MGIRPRKSIGWGITLKGAELRQKAVKNAFECKEWSYDGLIDHLDKQNLLSEHRDRGIIKKDKFLKLDKDKTLFNYVKIISESYDSDVDFDDENWTIIFYPMVLSALTFYEDGGIDEFKDGDSPFTYAEIERFFPESMETLKTVSYTIDTPPFPSEYSIVEKTVDGFELLKDKRHYPDIKRSLRSNVDDKYADIFAQVAGFENVDEVKSRYTLAPDEEIIAFAQYSGMFKNSGDIFELKPMVVYHWA